MRYSHSNDRLVFAQELLQAFREQIASPSARSGPPQKHTKEQEEHKPHDCVE